MAQARPFDERRYQELGLLGRGGMAEVYLVWDNRSRVQRAIKVLKPEYERHQEIRAGFIREARAMTGLLGKPNIVDVYYLGPDDPDAPPFMVMEYLPGGSLHRSRPVAPRDATRWVMEVLTGLEAAHRRPLVHRDIKPANLLLDAEGRVKIGDFGIARILDDSATHTDSVAGTVGYMAPEQGRKGATIDARTDIYAVGVTLFRLLTAEPPAELGRSDPQLLELMPPELLQIIRIATAHDPDLRYPSAESMRSALDGVFSELPAGTTDPEDTRPPFAPVPVSFPTVDSVGPVSDRSQETITVAPPTRNWRLWVTGGMAGLLLVPLVATLVATLVLVAPAVLSTASVFVPATDPSLSAPAGAELSSSTPAGTELPSSAPAGTELASSASSAPVPSDLGSLAPLPGTTAVEAPPRVVTQKETKTEGGQATPPKTLPPEPGVATSTAPTSTAATSTAATGTAPAPATRAGEREVVINMKPYGTVTVVGYGERTSPWKGKVPTGKPLQIVSVTESGKRWSTTLTVTPGESVWKTCLNVDLEGPC